jgi:hypothetical protein
MSSPKSCSNTTPTREIDSGYKDSKDDQGLGTEYQDAGADGDCKNEFDLQEMHIVSQQDVLLRSEAESRFINCECIGGAARSTSRRSTTAFISFTNGFQLLYKRYSKLI